MRSRHFRDTEKLEYLHHSLPMKWLKMSGVKCFSTEPIALIESFGSRSSSGKKMRSEHRPTPDSFRCFGGFLISPRNDPLIQIHSFSLPSGLAGLAGQGRSGWNGSSAAWQSGWAAAQFINNSFSNECKLVKGNECCSLSRGRLNLF